MTTYSYKGYLLTFEPASGGSPQTYSGITQSTLEIVVPDGVTSFSYADDGSDPAHEGSANIDIGAYNIRLAGEPLELGSNVEDQYAYVDRFEWGDGKVSYLLTITDDAANTTYGLLLGGDALPSMETLTEFEVWYDTVTSIGPPPAGSGFEAGDVIALSSISGVAISENDEIDGTDGYDEIDAGAGNDIVHGGGDDDDLVGGAGDDALYGDEGNDFLVGGTGDDLLDGGSGEADTASYAGSASGVVVNLTSGTASDGEGGTDTLVDIEDVRGSAHDDTITGNASNNVFMGLAGNDTFHGGDGTDMLRYDRDARAGGTSGVTVNLATGTATDGFGDTDTFTGMESVFATDGDDTITGNASANTFIGLGGNDTFHGGDGADTLRYDRDADRGGNGGVTVNLATGTATDGFGDTDTFTGMENVLGTHADDTITGNASDNWIGVDFGDDAVSGLAGDDNISGGAGNDALYGGEGNDFLVGGSGNDLLDGGEGWDKVSYFNASGAVVIDLANGTASDGEGGTDTLSGFESADGSFHDDVIIGDDGDNILMGLAGNDTLHGGGGIDTLSYDFDAYHGGAAGVTVDLSTGTATDGFGGSDTFDGMENVKGTDSDDTITGDGGANGLYAGAGNDLLYAGDGNDYLDGGSGDDLLDGGEGERDKASYLNASGAVMVDLANGTANDGQGGTDTLVGIEDAEGSFHDDVIIGDDGDNILIGLAGNDTLHGGSGIDTLSYEFDADQGGSAGVTVDLSLGTASDGFGGSDTFDGMENVTGTNSDDTITGDSGANALDAGAGNDIVHGGGGDDDLVGGAGDDALYGDEGNDFLVGGAGDDLLDGGTGEADTASYAGSASGVVVNLTSGTASDGESGTDTLVGIEDVRGSAHDDVITGSAGDNQFMGLAGNDTFHGGDGTDTLRYNRDARAGGTAGVTVNLATGTATDGFGDTDTFTGIENVLGTDASDSIAGSSAANLLMAGAGADIVHGGDGNDEIRGEGGDDELYGDAGDDLLFGSSGNDRLEGGAGNDVLVGGAGADVIEGGAGRDQASYKFSDVGVTVDLSQASASGGTAEGDVLAGIEDLKGSSHADVLTGDENANRIYGEAGNDALAGLAGDDRLYGGDGNDMLSGGAGNDQLYGGAGADVLDGGDGIDQVSYSSSLAGVTVNLTTGVGEGGTAEGDTLTAVENIVGSEYTDTLTGDAADNSFFALDGDDIISGGDGGDRFKAGNGNDTLSGDGGDDWFMGGAGADHFDGGSGADMMTYEDSSEGVSVNLEAGTATGGTASGDSFTAIENLGGSQYDDVLTGDASDNRLYGFGGDDTLSGGGGLDRIRADGGNDTLIGGDGDDWLSGGAGADVLSGGAGSDMAVYESSAAAVTVNLAYGTASGGDATGDSFSSIEDIAGSAHDDALTGDDNDNRLLGNGGDDVLSGGGGDDKLIGGAGNDALFGGNGDDYMVGGDGADSFDGGNGIDQVSYAAEGTAVTIDLAEGTGSGGAAGDTFTFIEDIYATAYADTINGSDADNRLKGGSGDDTLFGAGGTDRLYGDAGDDTIDGGAGNDYLVGGSGNDTFVFNTGWGQDIIADFEDGEDLIDVSATTLTWSDLDITQNGDDVLISDGGDSTIRLDDIHLADITEADFAFSSV